MKKECRCSCGSGKKTDPKVGWPDVRGSWKARWGIGRMDYRVEPGLYSIGSPTEDSPVFVSANYKMSFDRLRASLAGIDGRILVLDTQGINVWCAAGKGTFGTDELVRSVEAAALKDVVKHRRLVVPQLGAPGVSAPEVSERTGFEVVYGPVRACDIPAFLKAGCSAEPHMRKVRFGFLDRLVLVPMELVGWGLYLIPLAWLAALIGGMKFCLPVLIAYVSGAALSPLLLPVLPFRSFSGKGAVCGAAAAVLSMRALERAGILTLSVHEQAAWVLLIVPLTSIITAYFTGCSTFTSPSGVKKELRWAVPLQIASALAGIAVWAVGGAL